MFPLNPKFFTGICRNFYRPRIVSYDPRVKMDPCRVYKGHKNYILQSLYSLHNDSFI